MKTFNELKSIATKFKINTNIPCNPLLLCNTLQIKFIPLSQNSSLLNNVPAVFNIYEKAIYYDVSAKYSNFYIFHEIAHFILEHKTDSPADEEEANLLACLLIAPPKALPTYLKSANDLSVFAKIPLGRAEEYWSNLKKIKKPSITTMILIVLLLTSIMLNFKLYQSSVSVTNLNSQIIKNNSQGNNSSQGKYYYVTPFGKKYHTQNCKWIVSNPNAIKIPAESIGTREPCKDCIGNP